GATCSGKMTLAMHLHNIFPDSFITRQDDFAPPEATTPPVHPTLGGLGHCDDGLDWLHLHAFLRTIKRIPHILDDHSSHDHLNEQWPIPLGDSFAMWYKAKIAAVQKEVEVASDARIIWGVVNGFLLYWDQDVVDTLDARVFLRVPYDVLKERR
ncbi:hypothetical protein DFH94DRAFT_606917, partial [Russula ochroleuca]